MRRIFNYEEDPEKFEPSAKRIVEGVVSTPDDMFSIVFKNTKYLKSEIVKQFKDLPNVEFVIKGGLDDEVNEKYSCDFYQRNTHYSPSELDAVIRQFEKIEEKINPRWSDLAKAKFVYDALAKFIHYENDEEKQNKNTLNLMGIFTGRAICAGYSLIFVGHSCFGSSANGKIGGSIFSTRE